MRAVLDNLDDPDDLMVGQPIVEMENATGSDRVRKLQLELEGMDCLDRPRSHLVMVVAVVDFGLAGPPLEKWESLTSSASHRSAVPDKFVAQCMVDVQHRIADNHGFDTEKRQGRTVDQRKSNNSVADVIESSLGGSGNRSCSPASKMGRKLHKIKLA